MANFNTAFFYAFKRKFTEKNEGLQKTSYKRLVYNDYNDYENPSGELSLRYATSSMNVKW